MNLDKQPLTAQQHQDLGTFTSQAMDEACQVFRDNNARMIFNTYSPRNLIDILTRVQYILNNTYVEPPPTLLQRGRAFLRRWLYEW
jgi:hypothetical protein